MPQFTDFHDELKLPQDAIDGIAAGARAGEKDQFGVSQVELFHNPEVRVYGLLEAPDAQAVRDHHAALGVDCGAVHEVTGIRSTDNAIIPLKERVADKHRGGPLGWSQGVRQPREQHCQPRRSASQG